MNLVIDQGNTICKVAVYEQGKLLHKCAVSPKLTIAGLEEYLRSYPAIEDAIYSSVGERDGDLLRFIEKRGISLLELTSETPIPIETDYDRSTLGGDRLAAVVGVCRLERAQGLEILVIDVGTAITYERISAEGRYLGGNIAPGLYMRLAGMHLRTQRLPHIDEVEDANVCWGTDTISAMSAGALVGIQHEMEGYIRTLRSEYPTAKVFLTGGDAPLFASRLREPIEQVCDLVLRGLNIILEYNRDAK